MTEGPGPWLLPEGFRRLGPEARRAALGKLAEGGFGPEIESTGRDPSLVELSALMVENSIGYVPLPLGIASGFLIDGRRLDIPMATEEPSVIAAASYAARIVAREGGFDTEATDPVMTTQVFLEGVDLNGTERVAAAEARIRERMKPFLGSLPDRGGGWRGMRVVRLPDTGLVKVEFSVDVRDAMGANVLNTAAEGVSPLLEELSGGRHLMCILSNAASGRRGRARVRLPFAALPSSSTSSTSLTSSPSATSSKSLTSSTSATSSKSLTSSMPAMPSAETARRVALATALADEDPTRGVTHNKGIMNGITALALATFNDTRAIEAAAHAWAARSGTYRSLSAWRVEGESLVGELDLPLAFGTVGGAAAFHPASRLALRFLGDPGAQELARIAAALGLAQNLAALLALVTGGIQRGHMRHHAPRVAYLAGARGPEIALVAAAITDASTFGVEAARTVLEGLRAKDGRR